MIDLNESIDNCFENPDAVFYARVMLNGKDSEKKEALNHLIETNLKNLKNWHQEATKEIYKELSLDPNYPKKIIDPYNGFSYSTYSTKNDWIFTCVDDCNSSPKTYHIFCNDPYYGYHILIESIFSGKKNFDEYQNEFVIIQGSTLWRYLQEPFLEFCGKFEIMIAD